MRSAGFRSSTVIQAVAVGDKVCVCYADSCCTSLLFHHMGLWLQLPGDAKFNYFDAEGNMQEVSVEDLTKGKKVSTVWHWVSVIPSPGCSIATLPQVILFAVPGAFTPTCSVKHLPGFIEKADELKAKGIDTVACAPLLAQTLKANNNILLGHRGH